jgi:hypothetical protein
MRFGQKICTTTYISCLACLHSTSIFSVEDLKRNLTQLSKSKTSNVWIISKLSCTGLYKPLNNSYSPVTNNKRSETKRTQVKSWHWELLEADDETIEHLVLDSRWWNNWELWPHKMKIAETTFLPALPSRKNVLGGSIHHRLPHRKNRPDLKLRYLMEWEARSLLSSTTYARNLHWLAASHFPQLHDSWTSPTHHSNPCPQKHQTELCSQKQPTNRRILLLCFAILGLGLSSRERERERENTNEASSSTLRELTWVSTNYLFCWLDDILFYFGSICSHSDPQCFCKALGENV